MKIKTTIRKANQTGGLMFTVPAEKRRELRLEEGDFLDVSLRFKQQRAEFQAQGRAQKGTSSAGLRVTLPKTVATDLGITEGAEVTVELEPLILIPRSLLDDATLSRLAELD